MDHPWRSQLKSREMHYPSIRTKGRIVPLRALTTYSTYLIPTVAFNFELKGEADYTYIGLTVLISYLYCILFLFFAMKRDSGCNTLTTNHPSRHLIVNAYLLMLIMYPYIQCRKASSVFIFCN